ncbi:homodimeric phycobilin lyase, CpcS-III family [Synechococcus sp. PCC 7502]|uniref:phycobiliprotein lyase n=1 Tax=Synechococcus sp. PCC 7502 TaxID=1173263 RepID=UPI00029FF9F9|nr:phycobiliprotein lyase [Synechococcus sp. PCC 7502]AFY74623.1 homodimeric phycobilin lyase, CpcS-III family [Synechococcus sp. PCC 7502]
MTISDFFQHRAGTWASQRTSHHLIIKKSESGKSEIKVEFLEANTPDVTALCQEYNFDPTQAICGAKVTWDGSMEWDKGEDKHQGSTIIVAIAEGENIQSGKLLRQQGYAEKAPVVGRYVMGEDGVLSLITEYGTLYSEEKLWFPRPNVCMRAGITIGMSNVASYCTEIRKAT